MGKVTYGAVLAGLADEEDLVPFGGESAHKAFALAVGLQLSSTRSPARTTARCSSSRGRSTIRCRRFASSPAASGFRVDRGIAACARAPGVESARLTLPASGKEIIVKTSSKLGALLVVLCIACRRRARGLRGRTNDPEGVR